MLLTVTMIMIRAGSLSSAKGFAACAVIDEPDATGAALVKDWMPELQIAPGRVS